MLQKWHWTASLGHKLNKNARLKLQRTWIPWISITLLNTALLGWKWTLMTSCAKKQHQFGYMHLCLVSTRPTAHQIVLHEECFKEKPQHKKGHLGFQKLDPLSTKSLWRMGSYVHQVFNRQTKVHFWNLNGMKTF